MHILRRDPAWRRAMREARRRRWKRTPRVLKVVSMAMEGTV
jgi:hypothetical protein